MKTRLHALLLIVVCAFMLSGCPLKQSIGKSIGSFVHPVHGQNFVHISDNKWDKQKHALLYFYRPDSVWARQEIEAPSVYIDEHHYFNLRADAYTWMEVYPGKRQITMRRPFLGLEGFGHFALSLIADFELDVEAGQIYYLRFSEVERPEPNPDLPEESPLAEGDLQLVSRTLALEEIVETQFLKPDLLAPNHGAQSLVVQNRLTDFGRKKSDLKDARKQELKALKASGEYKKKWYWPFGGPDVTLDADRKIRALEVQKKYYKKRVKADKKEAKRLAKLEKKRQKAEKKAERKAAKQREKEAQQRREAALAGSDTTSSSWWWPF